MTKKIVRDKNIKKEVRAMGGITGLAAAAAGAYFMYGSKDAKKNRKTVKSWTLKMKAEVLEKIEKLKDIDEKIYKDIVSNATEKYSKLKETDTLDVEKIGKEMASHWREIKKNIGSASDKKVTKKNTKKIVKKVVIKKTTKKNN